MSTMRSEFQIEGFEELIKALKQVAPKLVKKHVNKTMRKGANIFLKEARRLAPRRSAKERRKAKEAGITQTLRKAIKIKTLKPKAARDAGFAIQILRSNLNPKAQVGKGFYPNSMEYGWKKKNGKTYPARPYMRPAFESKQDQVKDMILTELRAGLEQILASELGRHKKAA